jgi:hypothetical protein
MVAQSRSPVDIALQALASERNVPKEALQGTTENIRSGLEAFRRSRGAPQALMLTEALLRDELNKLVWPPAFGLALIQWALDLDLSTQGFLEAACIYLSLYYQELDEDIARCRSLLDERSESSSTQAARLLSAALGRVEPADVP